jgi:hypothetical protein
MVRRTLLVLAIICVSASADGQPGNSLAAYVEASWPEAAREGISRTTFDAAFAGLTADPGIIAATRRAPEYGKPFGSYLASLASPFPHLGGLAQIGLVGRNIARRGREIRRRPVHCRQHLGRRIFVRRRRGTLGRFPLDSRRWRKRDFSIRCSTTSFSPR